MRFVTNRIHIGKPANSLDDILKKVQAKSQSQTKVASAQGGTHKKANLDNLGDKKAKPFGSAEDKDTEKDTEEEVEVKDCEAETETEVKVASEEGVETYDAGKTEAKLVNDPKLPKDTKSGGDPKPAAKKGKDGLPTSGQPQWEGKAENNNNPEMPTDANTKASSEDLLKAAFSVLEGRFEKVANLKPELKKRTKDYWRALYGEDYAEAMVADK